MKKISVLFLLMLMVGISSAIAQTRKVSGRVLDETNQGLPGAGVSVKGSGVGTSTDGNGLFTLDVPTGSNTLVVQAIGYATKEVAITGGMLTVQMTNVGTNLGETVVTALGIRRNKAELGYAVQRVDGEDVTKTRSNNALNSLAGRSTGLEIKQNNQMGGSTNIVVRGNKSLVNNNQALIVVDGIPYDNSNNNSANQRTARGGYDYGNAAADINPDDIASVSVLKGAAATALYGSRGANGVILIETKKAKKGFGLSINMGGSVGSIIPSTFARYQKQYGAGYGHYYDTLDGEFLMGDINGDGNDDVIVPVSEDASFGAEFNPNLQVYDWQGVDPLSPKYGKTTPWVAAQNDPSTFFVKPWTLSNGFILNSGNDKGAVKVGYTNNVEGGMLPNSKIDKNLVSFSGIYNITEKLTAEGAANISIINGKGRYGTGYDAKNPMTNFRQWWQVNVDIKDLKAAYDRNPDRNTTWNWVDPYTSAPIYWDNPYWTRYRNYQTDERTRFFGNTALKYKLASWIVLTGRMAIDAYNESQDEMIDVGSIDVSEYRRTDRAFREANYDLMLNYDKSLTKDFKLSGIVGYNMRDGRLTGTSTNTNGGLRSLGQRSLTNSIENVLPPAEQYANTRVHGIYASAALGWKDLMFLELTGRRDQSSTLPSGSNTYFYPSASYTWLFSRMLDAPWLSYGKLRANIAGVGNDAPYGVTSNYFTNNASINGVPLQTAQTTAGNPNLVPERTVSKEVGFDLSFLRNRVNIDFTYYNALTKNQIVPIQVSTSTGYGFKYLNAGSVRNKGIELGINLKPVDMNAFTWNLGVNFTRNRNKVESLPTGLDNITLANMQGGVSINATLGEAYGTIRSKDYKYLNGQKLIDSTTGHYILTDESNIVVGNINPLWTMGILNSFRVYGITLSALIDIRKGGQFFSLDEFYGFQTGLYEETVGTNDLGNPKRKLVANGGGIIADGVNEDGSVNKTRTEFDYEYFNSLPPSEYITDASFVKLREITLGYSLPAKLFANSKILRGIDISFFGRNLAILSKKSKYSDPEDGMSSGNIQGYQTGAYPTTRLFGGNLKLNF